MSFSQGDLVRTSTTLGVAHGVVDEVTANNTYIVNTAAMGRIVCAEDELSAADATEATPDSEAQPHG